MSIKVIDFFSGCGGTSSGLRSVGFDIVGAIDVDSDATRTFSKNFPLSHVIRDDIRSLREEQIEYMIDDQDVMLFSGCAPCQPFTSQLTSKPDNDPRRNLLLEFLRFIQYYHPDFILVENVPGIQRDNGPENLSPFSTFVREIRSLGYFVDFKVIRAMDFGVPQCRRRLVLLASLVSDVYIPQPTHGTGLLPYSTVKDFIFGLPPIAAGETHIEDPDHQAARLSPLNLQRIRSTPEGGGMYDWPEELWLKSRLSYGGHTDVYGRLAWDRLASGLTTKCTSLSNGRFGHPDQDRALSLREAALLQTFPADFSFCGTLASRSKQVGNAVPPAVAAALGHSIILSLQSSSIALERQSS